jgi:cellulose synthase/poly-beta-1,6-N-acetylglucosamine synthase-like glycosyltransferase
MPTPSCTVVIPTRNRSTELERCLAALKQLDYPNFDVLVADNAPGDDRTRTLADRMNVRYLLEPRPGANRARNRGARACASDIIAYTDDDAVPEPNWLAELVREFDHPGVAAVTGRVLALRVETEAERLYTLLEGKEVGGPQRQVFDKETPHWFERANFGGIGLLANLAVRRQAFAEWNGFDERIDRGLPLDGGGEHLAFFELIEKGYRVVYTPAAVVRHALPSTPAELRARVLKDLANATAYMTLLLAEHPRHRRRLLRYIGEGLRGTPRTWRNYVPTDRPRIVPGWRKLIARLSGPFLYLQTRWQRL